MAVPKKRHSHGRTNRRRSHLALSVPPMSQDKRTKSMHRPHHVDLKTGFYRGRQVLFREEEQQAQPEAEHKDQG